MLMKPTGGSHLKYSERPSMNRIATKKVGAPNAPRGIWGRVNGRSWLLSAYP